MKVLSLDVDGVLADEHGHFKKLTQAVPRLRGLSVHDAAPYIWGSPLPHDAGFWDGRLPLYTGTGKDIDLLKGWEVQIVTRRDPKWEGRTHMWITEHYPWLNIARIACIGSYGNKGTTFAEHPADAAIDDSMSSMSEYLAAGTPVIMVRSYLTDPHVCLRKHVPVAADFGEALDLLVTLPVRG